MYVVFNIYVCIDLGTLIFYVLLMTHVQFIELIYNFYKYQENDNFLFLFEFLLFIFK